MPGYLRPRAGPDALPRPATPSVRGMNPALAPCTGSVRPLGETVSLAVVQLSDS